VSVITILENAGNSASWRRLALCAGHPDRAAWFGDFPEQTDRAVAVCRACPVRQPCLSHALDNEEMLGIWGGTTPRERRRMIRSRGRAIVSAS
jgi:WhiB family redox-sensing transcriptional regulator